MSSMLDAALEYVRRGWSVIPLRFTGSIEERKRPLLDSWEPYQHERATEEQVRSWWTKWPLANIGLVMGAVSGLVALDLDGPNAVALLHEAKVFLPKTAAVQTKRGYHAFYAHTGYVVPNRAKLLSDGNGSGVDVRGDGGYVVAPPSVHGSGWVYQWVVAPEDGILPLPDGVAGLLDGQPPSASAEPDTGWFEAAWRGAPDGQRNETAARLAGYWLHVTKGNEEASYRAMEAWALRCQPPMDLKELRATIRSVARREAAKQAHERSKTLPRHAIIEGPQWAEELREKPARRGTAVALPALDLIDGLVPGDLVILAGRPGMGKSTMACQLTVEACFKKGLPTWVVSTEMTRAQWGEWMAAYVAKKGTASLPRPLPETILSWWRTSPIAITDSGILSIQDLRTLAHGRLGVKLIIVDHITRLVGGRKETRVLEVGDVARGLKSLAKDLHCTVVALCQLSRRVEGDDSRRPRLSDLRESGELEQEADAVLFLWTPKREIHEARLPMYVTVAKNHHGPLGQVSVMFDKPLRRFIEEAHAPQA